MLPTTKKMDMDMHHHPSISSKVAPAAFCFKDDAAEAAAGRLKNKGSPIGGDRLKKEEKAAVVGDAAVDVCLAAAAMAGAALLTWWAVAFHPSYAQLWMVPLGLVLACTPPVVCLALRFSGNGGGAGSSPGGGGGSAEVPTLAAVVVHK